MSSQKLLLLRVGMDLGYGALGPIFEDGRFEYIPIPESEQKVSSRTPYFSKIPARSGGSLDRFLPSRLRHRAAHLDPEFETFTYGDPTRSKRGQLLRLSKGDLLVFYAGLRPPGDKLGSRLYVIGFFTIESVWETNAGGSWPPPEYRELWANAHFRRKDLDPGLVVAKGARAESRLLDKAIPLSDDRQEILPELEPLLGLSGSVKRAGAGRWVPPEHVARTKRWIRQDLGASIVGPDA